MLTSMPCRSRVRASSSPSGPGSGICCGPTVTTTTLRARLRNGLPIATVTAVRVLAFPAIATSSSMALALKGTIDLRRDRKSHFAAEHHRVLGREAVQSDNMAVEALRSHESGVENRPGIAVADYG